jgi:hypothetical protein
MEKKVVINLMAFGIFLLTLNVVVYSNIDKNNLIEDNNNLDRNLEIELLASENNGVGIQLQPGLTPGPAQSVRTTWTDSSPGVTTYFEVERADDSAFTTGVSMVCSPVNVPNAFCDDALSGLIIGNTYYYRVRACDASTCSSYSIPVSIALNSFTPTSPTALNPMIASINSIVLNWIDNSGNEFYYEVERDGSNLVYLSADSTTYTDNTVVQGNTYSYIVKSCDPFGVCSLDAFFDITHDVPNVPIGLNSPSSTSTQVDLQWVDNSDNEQGFVVQRRVTGSGSGFSSISSPPNHVAAIQGIGGFGTFIDVTVVAGMTYDYRVYAFNIISNQQGSSGYSNLNGVVIPGGLQAPNAPTGFNGNAV